MEGDVKSGRFKDWQYFSQSQLRLILMDIRRQVSQNLMKIRGGSLGKGEQVTVGSDKEHAYTARRTSCYCCWVITQGTVPE